MDIVSIISLVIVGIAILLALFVLIKGGKRKLTAQQQKFLNKQWETIVCEYEQNPQKAVMDADKLLGYLLEAKGYEGSIGEMLKKSGPIFKNVNNVWEAHKMRNKIAHEIGVTISPREVKSILSKFKSAFKDLGAKL
jgi:transposase